MNNQTAILQWNYPRITVSLKDWYQETQSSKYKSLESFAWWWMDGKTVSCQQAVWWQVDND